MTYEMTVNEIKRARVSGCPHYSVTTNGKTEWGQNWEYEVKDEIIALLDPTKTYEVYFLYRRHGEYGKIVVEETP